LRVRPISAADLDALSELVTRANARYREWASPEWRPPGIDHERERWRERLEDSAAWSVLAASVGGRPLGCVSFTDARASGAGDIPIAGLAHLSRMFVDPPYWGRGLGTLLLERAVAEMRNRGYRRAQLYTAVGNARSRRFYERHGWDHGDETRRWHGLILIRYTLDLTNGG
jgi:RimJ/RimL family protein N-acetyltransferase